MDFSTALGYPNYRREMKEIMRHFVVVMGCAALMVSTAYADSAASNSQSAFGSSSGKTESGGDSGRFGVGVKTSFLGVGAEVGARVTHKTNARVGFNILGYSRNF